MDLEFRAGLLTASQTFIYWMGAFFFLVFLFLSFAPIYNFGQICGHHTFFFLLDTHNFFFLFLVMKLMIFSVFYSFAMCFIYYVVCK